MFRYPVFYFLCIIFFVIPFSYATNIQFQVKGLSGKLEKNVNARLSTIKDDNIIFDSLFQTQVNIAIRQGLCALGYYHPIIYLNLQQKSVNCSTLIITVIAGKAVLISGTNIQLRGDAKNDQEYQELIIKETPKIGSVLNHGEFDNFTRLLSTIALRKGYFDANMIKKQLGVADKLYKAFWDIDFDSHQRYRFGKVIFQGSQIREDYLKNLIPFAIGNYYHSDDLAELNRRLAATNWFNSSVVSPNFSDAKDNKILPLDAIITPRKKNIVAIGGGYATDTGPRLKASWSKPWINNRGHSFTSNINISTPAQIIDLSYRIPLLINPLDHYYLLQSGLKRNYSNDTKSYISTLNVARFWNMPSGWKPSVNLRWSLDRYTQRQLINTTILFYPGVSITRTRQLGRILPTWGDSQRYSFYLSNRLWGSNVDFLIIQAQQVWNRSFSAKNRLILSWHLGWIETNSFNRVPLFLRFFAGGDHSIRGYKYQSISPLDSKGKITGASKLITVSLEYQYKFANRFWGAIFFDGGEAVNDIRCRNFKIGAGIGINWESPLGPLKFDFALPVGDKKENSIQFYIGLGPAL